MSRSNTFSWNFKTTLPPQEWEKTEKIKFIKVLINLQKSDSMALIKLYIVYINSNINNIIFLPRYIIYPVNESISVFCFLDMSCKVDH